MVEKSLIKRLKQRIQVSPFIDMHDLQPISPQPPVSIAEFAAAEAALGFPLPPLVRAIYTEAANGGFGPGYGLKQLNGDDESIVKSRLLLNEVDEEELGPFPERLILFVDWGCNLVSGIDCSHPSCPVIFFDSDIPNPTYSDCLFLESDSLASWLTAWLNGVNLWDSRPVNDTPYRTNAP